MLAASHTPSPGHLPLQTDDAAPKKVKHAGKLDNRFMAAY